MMKQFILAFAWASAFAAAPQTFEMSGGAAVWPVEQHFRAGQTAFDAEKWQEAIYQLGIVVINFPNASEVPESHYLRGRAYYRMKQWDFAEREFTHYLEKSVSPRHFEEVVNAKFAIANHYRDGVHKHMFGLKRFPKWVSARADALRLYDEVATALPSSELAAQSLYRKAELLWTMKSYQEASEAFQALIYRFPNHAYAPDSYLAINKVFLSWSRDQPQNPDLLPLAMVNTRKFRKDFPADERLLEAEKVCGDMREVLAGSMMEMARFYERTGKPGAAQVYFQAVTRDYSGTTAARESQEALALVEE